MRRIFPYLLLLAIVAVFFWQFTVLGHIPIDSAPFYQMRPWSAGTKPVAAESVRHYPNIDPVVEIFPIKKWLSEQLRSGHIPLWTPAIFSGAPFAANHHAAPWDFSTPLFLVLPTDLAFGMTLLLQLFAAGASMFFLCRVLGFSVRSSLFAATAFLFNSFFFHWLGLISFNAGLIWMPLIPAGIELCFRRNSLRYCGISAAGLGLAFLSGMGQFWLFNVALFAAYALYRLGSGISTRRVGALVLAGALGAGLGAAQITATVTALRHTSRGGDTQASLYEGRNHLSPRRLPTLLVPDLYGSTEENVFSKLILNSGYPEATGWAGRLLWGEKGTVFNRVWGYIGIPAFLMMLIGFCKARGPVRFFRWLAAGVITFQVLLCWETFHAVCTRLWSGFDTLDHTRMIVLYILAASILAAEGMEQPAEWNRRGFRRIIAGAALSCLLIIAAFNIVPRMSDIPALVQKAAVSNETYSSGFFLDAGPKIAQGFYDSAKILYVPFAVFVAVFACVFFAGSGRWTAQTAQTALLIVSLADLAYHGWRDPPLEYTERNRLYPPPTKVVEFLKQDPGTFRVYELQRKRPVPPLPLSDYSGLQSIRRSNVRFFDLQSVEFVLRPNVLMAYGIDSAGGYMSLYPGRYRKLWSGRGMDILKALKAGQDIASWNTAWIGMQNIKYIVAPEEFSLGTQQPALQAEGVKVFRVDSYLPRVYAVPRMRVVEDVNALLAEVRSSSFHPDREVLLEHAPPQSFSSESVSVRVDGLQRTPDTMQFAAEMSSAGYLVLAENNFPGWHATVDGKEQPLLTANYILQCLPLQGGRHEIRLEFRPPYYTISLLISLASAAAILMSAAMRDPGGNHDDHRRTAVL